MNVAAFFDMDRTLLRCNTGVRWIQFLRRRGEISIRRALRAAGWIARYKLALLDMEEVLRIAASDMAGDTVTSMQDKCGRFFAEEVVSAISPQARATVDEHRRAGHLLAILSSSTPYITEPLASHLGIEYVLCTRLEIEDGHFVGTHVRPACYGAGKVHWAEHFAREHVVDLGRSWFYTDSYSDLPMLERVGERRVVNPDLRLRRHARQVGWPVCQW